MAEGQAPSQGEPPASGDTPAVEGRDYELSRWERQKLEIYRQEHPHEEPQSTDEETSKAD